MGAEFDTKPQQIENDHALEDALNKLNDDFNTELRKNKKYKWYSPRIGNLVIPQVYDDSLSYYEAINKLNLLLHCEIERAMNAENLLGINLDTEIQRAKQDEADLAAALANEINRAKREEARLDNKIDNETGRAKQAEKVLTDNLNAEVARAKQAESDLNTALNNEIDRAKAAELANTKLINDETTRATNKETELDTAIKAETTRATGREDALNTAINTETTRATNKETELDTAIKAETARAKAEEAKAVTNVTMESNAHTHVFKKTINGVTSEIGEIDTDEGNPVIEVKDSVVENATSGFDFHTLSETTADGTSNNIGQAYIAKKQVTDISLSNDALNIKTVDQTGKEETASHEVVTPATLQEAENEIDGKIGLGQLWVHSETALDNNAIYDLNVIIHVKAPENISLPELKKIINGVQVDFIRPTSEAETSTNPIVQIYNFGPQLGNNIVFNANVQTFSNSNVSRIDFVLTYLNKTELKIDFDNNNGINLTIVKKRTPFIPTIVPNPDSNGNVIAMVNELGANGNPASTYLYNCIRSTTGAPIYKISIPNANFTKGIYIGYTTTNAEEMQVLQFVLTPLSINATNNACLISFTRYVDSVNKPVALLVFCWANENETVSTEFVGFGNLNTGQDVNSTYNNVKFTKLI